MNTEQSTTAAKPEDGAGLRSKDGLGIWCVAVACDLVTEGKGFWGSSKNETCLNQRIVTAGNAEVAKALGVAAEFEFLNKCRPLAEVTLRQCNAHRIKDA